MVRPNRLSILNNKIIKPSPIDIVLQKMGGTLYNNCFSPGPDTPRSMASFHTGKIPNVNGCNSRLKWPRYYLKNDLKTIYDLFIEKNYEMNFFSNPNERDTGIFPEKISNMNIHNTDYNLNKYLSDIKLKDNHLIFIGLPDYHWALDDNGYTHYGEKIAQKEVSRSLNIIFENLNKDDFDHIFFFSDHGFKFVYEYQTQPNFMLINEDRSQILLMHKSKNSQNALQVDDTLLSITDIYSAVSNILNSQEVNQLQLFNDYNRKYVIIEDHCNFDSTVNQNIDIWGLVMKDKIYVRDLKKGYLINRTDNTYEELIIQRYDEILKNETSFKKYLVEYEIINKNKNLLLKQTDFMSGRKRKKTSKIFNYLNTIIDRINNISF
jgi:hypothetical protein